MGVTLFYGNDVKIYQFKAKNTEIEPHPLCLGNTSKDFMAYDNKKG